MVFPRFFSPPGESYFLFGPRGTGKSTWLKARYPEATWINLLDPETFRFFAGGAERLAQIPLERTVVIDEVQRLPELLNMVHIFIEKKEGFQFILTGSSARKLKKEGVNLLGGRALLKYMSPFYAKELGSSFQLHRNLLLGMLPIVLDAQAPEEVLRAYTGIYLKEEVQAEGIVRNVGDFARFLETMSFSHASLINTSNIARESHITRKTIDGYLQILNDLLLSFQLSVFRRKAKRALASHTKFYFFDAGVYRSMRPQNLYDPVTETEGAALEGLVAQHLKAWVNERPQYQLHFWRTSSQLEVDFILSGADCFYAIEVKNGTTIHPQDVKSLELFCEDYPEATPLMLYRGKQRFEERGVLCIPVDEFLLRIDPRESPAEMIH